jgi:hypothetical protein
LTDQLLSEGFTRRQVAQILSRNSAIVSHFYTRGPRSGAAYVEGLRSVLQEVQAGGPRDVETLKQLAAQYVRRRRTKDGRLARVRTRDTVQVEHDEEWTSGLACAGRQHLASGGSRILPVIEKAAAAGGVVAFTVRASKGRFLIDSGDEDDSPEERSYGNASGPPSARRIGFAAGEWHQRITEHNGDVTATVTDWMVETGRLAEGAQITHLELRAWKPPST